MLGILFKSLFIGTDWRGSLEKSVSVSLTALFCSVVDEEKGTKWNGNIFSLEDVSIRFLDVFETNIKKKFAHKQLYCNNEKFNIKYF